MSDRENPVCFGSLHGQFELVTNLRQSFCFGVCGNMLRLYILYMFPYVSDRDELMGVLPRVQTHLNARSDRIAEYTELVVQEERLQELRKVLQEAQSNNNSPIFSLHDRFVI